MKHLIIPTMIVMTASAAMTQGSDTATFGDDVAFLRSHTDIIVLSDEKGLAKVAIAPAWQGRVMTSTAGNNAGRSFGWVNRGLIASGKLVPHMNAFGGEDRLLAGAGRRAVFDLLCQRSKVRVRELVCASAL